METRRDRLRRVPVTTANLAASLCLQGHHIVYTVHLGVTVQQQHHSDSVRQESMVFSLGVVPKSVLAHLIVLRAAMDFQGPLAVQHVLPVRSALVETRGAIHVPLDVW